MRLFMFIDWFLFYVGVSGISFVQIQTSSLLFTDGPQQLSWCGLIHNRSLWKNEKSYRFE